MRSFSATLLQAQKSPSRAPFVKVEVLDRVGGIPRPRYKRHYTGTETDYFHAATMPSDGSLVRARVQPGDYDLYTQRVPNPTPSSDFSAWSLLTTSAGGGGVALCSEGATVLLAYLASTQRSIRVREQ